MSEGGGCSSETVSFAESLAERSGRLLMEFFSAGTFSSRLKEDASIVTEADLAADKLIHESIGQAFGEDAIISEEIDPQAKALVGREATWVVDPLDGTSNFSLGLPFWGVSIARVVGGHPQLAVAYFPALGEMFVAVRGQGTTLNGQPTSVATPEANHGVGFLACCSRTNRFYNVALPLKIRVLGSAAYSLCAVAKGSAALALETTPRIWDIAAATLLVEEAGGIVQAFGDSRAFPPFPLSTVADYSKLTFTTLAAASPELASMANESITPRVTNL